VGKDEFMFHKFRQGQPLLWVFDQALQNEVFGFTCNGDALGEVDLLVHDLYEVFLGSDFERNATIEEFIC
jgi:hypothetical protein